MKRHAALCAAMAAALVGCGGGGGSSPIPAAHAEPPKPLIAVIGDSITAGYMPHDGVAIQLRQDLAYTTELRAVGHVVTAAVGGVTAAEALKQAKWLAPLSVDVVVVMLGVNDADQRRPHAAVLEDMRAIVATWPRARVVLASPPSWGTGIDPWLAQWERELQVYANSIGARMVPVYSTSLTRTWRCHSDDRHPCAAGHREIGAAIAAAIKS